MTDETVRLTTGSNTVSGFPKPLSIKPAGRHVVAHLEQWMIPPVSDAAPEFHFVPIGATGATLADAGTAHLVVLLRRPGTTRRRTPPLNGCTRPTRWSR